MRGVATVASFLNEVAALTKGGADFLRDTKVFPLDSHPVETNGVTTLPKLSQPFRVTFSTFFWENHRFLLGGCLMVDVTSHAVDAFPGMLRLNPRLEEPGCYLLMAGDAKAHVHLRDIDLFRNTAAQNQK